ncbi:MAG: 3',5'-cyclic-nucleotide phosphodiesterase [Deltaproteobacteria bacterium]|jgi:ribonuclease BN (tRNA processing enzyme)|nr:3',5'-cyclic-nucleotide phosphodiesterase [Deltaproteobacteria bacterium]MBP6834264.1 3',5'-cyclic-nucleotide phosphodiesterase [Deltaproteobacteria bacterium]
MELKVLGCHGGETARHRTTSFLVDGRLALDAGATTAMLTLEEQMLLDAVVVSHAHLDHVRDLASLADNRCQGADRPLVIAGTGATIRALKEHFFNNVLWPDFTNIPLVGGTGPTVELKVLEPEVPQDIAGYSLKAVLVSHTIESAGIVLSRDGAALAFSGDTGPTERFWEVLAETPGLRAVLQEVSFPNELEWLARVSGHHTPSTLGRELLKFTRKDIPWLMFHIKPAFQAKVERELSTLHEDRLELLSLGDEFVL